MVELVRSQSINLVLDKLRGVVGVENVVTSAEGLAARSRDTSLWHRTPSVVVYPATAQEVAEVVRIGAEFRLAVWPFSKGRNWGYGASMAFEDGAVIVVLERMNRIVEVNQELAYAVIEPGVTQGQLNTYLKANRMKFWADSTDSTPEGSVIGNALERGVGYTPYSDHFGNLCGLEVVLPNGDLVRTGGGPEGSHTWHTYKWGTGPYIDGLFSQSNLGIVVKAGVWLMPEPEAFNCFICELRDERDLPGAIDTIRRLRLDGILRANVHIVNDVLFMAQMMQYPYDLTTGEGRMRNEVRAELRRRFKIAPWSITGGIYGTAEQVTLVRAVVKKALSPYGRITILNDRRVSLVNGLTETWKLLRPVPGVSGALSRLTGSSLEKFEVLRHVYPILKGEPGEFIVSFAYFKSRYRPRRDVDPARDAAGLSWMAVLTPMTGRHVSELLALCEPIFRRHELDMSTTFIMVNPRTALALMQIFYNREIPEECQRALALHHELMDITVKAGYQQYRASVADSRSILNANPQFQNLADTIKRAVDPDRVIAPARYGIGL
ncbi:MAG: FAD-binding oxidoreductase [Pseudonocardiaceae bacterium]